MLENWTDTDLFNFVNYVNAGLDILVLVVALVVLRRIKDGPNFTRRGLYLVSASSVIDAVYQLLCIYFTHPPFEIELFLYSLTGLDIFSDVMIYWIIAFLYWVTAINITEFQKRRTSANVTQSLEHTSLDLSTEKTSHNKKPVIFLTYTIVLIAINIVYIVTTLWINPTDGPNEYMEFNHATAGA